MFTLGRLALERAVSVCNFSDLGVCSVVNASSTSIHHRDTEKTKVAQSTEHFLHSSFSFPVTRRLRTDESSGSVPGVTPVGGCFVIARVPTSGRNFPFAS